MAALYGVATDELLVTRGADDAIDVLVRTFCRPAVDAVSICPPTFAAYAHFALLQGARVIEAPLGPDFELDAEALLARLAGESPVKLVFLCSPNNPTGNVIARADILHIADALPETILVLDEAYVEFADVESLAAEAVRRPNMVVLRTLSKAFGLAGARVGAAIGNKDLIALAGRAMAPYPLPSLSIAAASAALAPARRPIHAERIARIKADRETLAPLLAGAPGVDKVRSGGANFLFLEVAEPEAPKPKMRPCSPLWALPRRCPTAAAPSWSARPGRPRSPSPSTSTRPRPARSTPASPSSTTCSTRSPRMEISRSCSTARAISRSTRITAWRIARSPSARPCRRRLPTGAASAASASHCRWTRPRRTS
jgi:histidinol-phosphate aminotransferase